MVHHTASAANPAADHTHLFSFARAPQLKVGIVICAMLLECGRGVTGVLNACESAELIADIWEPAVQGVMTYMYACLCTQHISTVITSVWPELACGHVPADSMLPTLHMLTLPLLVLNAGANICWGWTAVV